MDLVALIDWLNEEARVLMEGLGGAVRIEARSLDLRPHLSIERLERRGGTTEQTSDR